jgi:hypothetical protein
MSTQISPYHRPWIWLLRQTSVLALLTSVAWAAIATGINGVPQVLAIIVLPAVIIVLATRMIADIFAAGFCRWLAAMGHGIGTLVSSIRYARR